MRFENKKIIGVGAYVPPNSVTNNDLELNDEWVQENLGIKERCVSTESVALMGYYAALEALDQVFKEEVDAVIVSCSSTSHNAPSVASQICGMLEIKVPNFDINAVCGGFVYALELGCTMIQSGGYQNILIIATERYSQITDYSTRDCVYFGDGAGAIVLTEGHGTITTVIDGDGDSGDAFVAPVGETFSIIGRKVYDKALDVLPTAVDTTLWLSGRFIDEIDYVVPHQAGIGLLKALALRIHCPFEKFVTVMDKYANIASASIPMALAERPELLDKRLLLIAIGSGWTWGVAVIECDVNAGKNVTK